MPATTLRKDARVPGEHAARKELLSSSSPTSPANLLLLLIAFRLVNAVTIQTFFQPDEYFQSLEPAWQMAFGADSGAWITWEWRHRLRSSIHPAIFALVYTFAARISDALSLSVPAHANLLVEIPKCAQAIFAALGDYYTWKLAVRVYGKESKLTWVTLALTLCSPWQWFCSTRSFSNCLETTLTIVALCHWPWHWTKATTRNDVVDANGLRIESKHGGDEKQLSRVRWSLFLAAFACILRPTNVLIWIPLSLSLLWSAGTQERLAILLSVFFCGSVALGLSVLCDRLYYQQWTFPPLLFLYFNLGQSLSVFYGINDWHYYLSQGLPLLLTTALPFVLVGLWQALRPIPVSSTADVDSNGSSPNYWNGTERATRISHLLSLSILTSILALSLVAHKEVRFIYPLLPALHIFASSSLYNFFLPLSHPSFRNRVLLPILLGLNLLIAGYTTRVHNSGLIPSLTFLRNAHEVKLLNMTSPHSTQPTTSVGFLMPCHSTPWRSHLVYPSIRAWALTCEPPVNMAPEQRAAYVDEADRFYADPAGFLRREFVRPPSSHAGGLRAQGVFDAALAGRKGDLEEMEAGLGQEKKEWPEYLVFFEQLEEVLGVLLGGSGYRECWRGFNTHWHDDWRRKGDVVIWCLH